jgi:GNAT superfamily N-acetyltransferase
MSEQESDAMHAQIDEHYKRCPVGEYAHTVEIYRNTVRQLFADGVKSGVIAYSRTQPGGMMYGYCNCGAKETYKGLPMDWKTLPSPDGARVFAILDMLIPTNFEGCGLENKLLTYALEQAKAQGYTHAECFLHELDMRGTEPHERTTRFERMLATYAELGFVERADLSHEHGRCYILQKEL